MTNTRVTLFLWATKSSKVSTIKLLNLHYSEMKHNRVCILDSQLIIVKCEGIKLYTVNVLADYHRVAEVLKNEILKWNYKMEFPQKWSENIND